MKGKRERGREKWKESVSIPTAHLIVDANT
jgi:hypothetical protein